VFGKIKQKLKAIFKAVKSDRRVTQEGKAMRKLSFIFVSMLILTMSAHASTVYVDASAAGSDSGASWADAYTNLQSALTNTLTAGDEIWVAEGTYLPTTNGIDASATFNVPSDVSLYGGFSGTETSIDQRDISNNETVLSGAIGTSNSITVVKMYDVDQVIIDGFVITGGGDPGSSAGGGIDCADSGNVQISNCLLTNNISQYGAASSVKGGTTLFTLTNCVVSENVSVNGAIYVAFGARLAIENSSFVSNRSSGPGGAIHVNGSSVDITTESLFSGNEAGTLGGALYLTASTGNITNSTFSNNTAENIGGWGYGGAVYAVDSDCSFSGVVLSENDATSSGGAIQSIGSSSALKLTGCHVISNTTESGSVYLSSTAASIGDTIFEKNSSVKNAGALYIEATTVDINHSIFSENSGENGAGIYLMDSTATVTNSLFSKNTAKDSTDRWGNGGAIFATKNTVGSSVSLQNSTLFGNTSRSVEGGSLYLGEDHDAVIINTIFWGNRGNGMTNQIHTLAGTMTVSYSCIEGAVSNITGTTTLTDGGNNIDSDPTFTDWASPIGADGAWATYDDGLHPGVPCIDAGDDAAIATTYDLTGSAQRKMGTAVDIGAYEIGSYTLTYLAGINGSVTGTSPQFVDPGTEGTEVTAVPDSTYTFSGWSDGKMDNPRQDLNVKSNITVTANFDLVLDPTLTFDPPKYIPGSNMTFTVVFNGYDELLGGKSCGFEQIVPDGWGDDIADFSLIESNQAPTFDGPELAPAIDEVSVAWAPSLGSYTVTSKEEISYALSVPSGFSGDADFELVATWNGETRVVSNLLTEAELWTLTYSAGANGSLSGSTSQNVYYGLDGTSVTALPNSDYHFVQWSDLSIDNPRTDTGVTNDITVTATFAIDTFNLTYLATANGSLSGDTSQTVDSGSAGTAVTANPTGGYKFVGWDDGLADNPRTDTTVRSNITVTAYFASVYHSADTDEDFKISIPELLRAVELYNSAGFYKLDPAGEDGYNPAGSRPTIQAGYHSADYAPSGGDWEIGAPEYLRLLELRNADDKTYVIDLAGEDGYNPTP